MGKKPPANNSLELFLIQEKMRGGYHTYKGTFRMQNSRTLLLLLCQFGNQTVGMEGIRNDLPLSFSYVSVAEGGTQYSVPPSSDPGRSKYVRAKKGSEGKETGQWGLRKLTVSSLWRFSIRLHVLII